MDEVVDARPTRRSCVETTAPFSMGWLGPVGLSWLDALASSQLYAPHRPSRSGVTTQMWLGAKLWHSEHE